jgi:hypothetical protein
MRAFTIASLATAALAGIVPLSRDEAALKPYDQAALDAMGCLQEQCWNLDNDPLGNQTWCLYVDQPNHTESYKKTGYACQLPPYKPYDQAGLDALGCQLTDCWNLDNDPRGVQTWCMYYDASIHSMSWRTTDMACKPASTSS